MRLKNSPLVSSARQDWETPDLFFSFLEKEHEFTLDAAATSANAKCKRFITPDEDALTTAWGENQRVWVNPPYGRDVERWLARGHDAAVNHGCLVVFLLPARCDTRWFHRYAPLGQVVFLQRRITFKGASAPAPFPSMLIIFRPGLTSGDRRFDTLVVTKDGKLERPRSTGGGATDGGLTSVSTEGGSK